MIEPLELSTNRILYKARPLARKSICELAKEIRHSLNYEKKQYFPIIEFIELILPQIDPLFELEIKPNCEMPDKCGETFPNEHRIVINEIIYEKAIEGDGFARTSCAHEVGHLLTHTGSNVSLCCLMPGERLKPYEDPEWQADVFAGELLAPNYLIIGLSAEEVAKKFGVTVRAAEVQLQKLKEYGV